MSTRAKPSAEAGIWVVVLPDIAMFCILFATYLVYRAGAPESFAGSQAQLSTGLGVANTLILLAGSVAVAGATGAYREGRGPDARRLLTTAALLAAAFVVVKGAEWGGKISQGLTPRTDGFFMFYYGLTGLHLLHVVIGIAILLLMRGMAGRGPQGRHDVPLVESGAVFWHMVDMVWLVLFPIIYLVH